MTPLTRRKWGVAALVSGIFIGVLPFAIGIFILGCDPFCLFTGMMFPSLWRSIFVWIPLTIILGTALFFVGIALLASPKPKNGWKAF